MRSTTSGVTTDELQAQGLTCAWLEPHRMQKTSLTSAQAGLNVTTDWCREEAAYGSDDEEFLGAGVAKLQKGDATTYSICILISKSRDHISSHRVLDLNAPLLLRFARPVQA